MPRRPKGSVYRERSGAYGIRWVEDGKRPQRGGFKNELEARAWFDANVLARIQPKLQDACNRARIIARRSARETPGSWIYVIAAPDVQRIKIGRTVVPGKRLKDLRTACPMAINALLIMPGGKALEDKLHEITRPYAIAGAGTEWRTLEALEVVFAYVRELAACSPMELRRAA